MCLAIPGELLEVSTDAAGFATGLVQFGGVRRSVSLMCLPEAVVGDYVLVHAGIALSTIDEDEAATVFEYLKQCGEMDEELASDSTDSEVTK